VSPIIVGNGGTLRVTGGINANTGGAGRIRIESMMSPTGTITYDPAGVQPSQLGEFLPPLIPRLTLLSWLDQSTIPPTWQPITQDPLANTTSGPSADVALPNVGPQTIRIQGRNIPAGVPLHIRTTFTHGQAVFIDTTYAWTDLASTFDTSWMDVQINFVPGVSAVQLRAEL
jgi:hypothetical protein